MSLGEEQIYLREFILKYHFEEFFSNKMSHIFLILLNDALLYKWKGERCDVSLVTRRNESQEFY